jgi:hypothetical protein
VIDVALVTVKHGAPGHAEVTSMAPTDTLAVVKPEPVKPLPVTVTAVPPLSGPLLGATLVTVGAATYVYWSALEVPLVPPGVVTVMWTVPADSAGTSTVMLVGLVTLKHGAVPQTLEMLCPPTVTWVVVKPLPVKPVPETVTPVPPLRGPLVGATLVTVGAVTYVY